MEKTGVKSSKFRTILALIIAVLMLGYIGAMTMPFVTYTQLDSKKLSDANAQLEKGKTIKADWTIENEKFVLSPTEFAAGEKTVSLMQYLWLPYKFGDLTRDVLPNIFTDAGLGRYTISKTIGFPLFSFLAGIIGAVVIALLRKKNWSVFFPIVWSIGTLIGYVIFPVFGIMHQTSMIVQIVIAALVLILSLIFFFLYALPSMRYNMAHREKY